MLRPGFLFDMDKADRLDKVCQAYQAMGIARDLFRELGMKEMNKVVATHMEALKASLQAQGCIFGTDETEITNEADAGDVLRYGDDAREVGHKPAD